MNQTGVLILHPSKRELHQLSNLLRIAAKHVQRVLYLDFNLNPSFQEDTARNETSSPAEMYGILEKTFKKSTPQTAELDVRVLLENDVRSTAETETETERKPRRLSQPIDVALLHSSFQSVPGIVDTVYKRYNFAGVSPNNILFVSADEESEDIASSCSGVCDGVWQCNEMKTYRTVAVGGTFDR